MKKVAECVSLDPYDDFISKFEIILTKNKDLTRIVLSNIFSMRVIGNKTHGDIAEVGISEFIDCFMIAYKCRHVGKDNFRKKSKEEDILVTNLESSRSIPISLKAYGMGPLQLSTDKTSSMFSYLSQPVFKYPIMDESVITEIVNNQIFKAFESNRVLAMLYSEKELKCKIVIYDFSKALNAVKKISFEKEGNGRKHPVYRFYDKNDKYIFEIRYGGKSANALQRGLWTDSKRADAYFKNLTGGWVDYEQNLEFVDLISKLMLIDSTTTKKILNEIKASISTIVINE